MPIACPDPEAISTWRAMTMIVAIAPLFVAPFGFIMLWRVRRIGAFALITSATSTALVVATGVTSAFLFLRLRDMIAQIAQYFPRYPSSCVSAGEFYGHFSPPPGFFEALQRSIAQVVSLEAAAAVDSAVAVAAIIAVLACALIWGRRRPPMPVTA